MELINDISQTKWEMGKTAPHQKEHAIALIGHGCLQKAADHCGDTSRQYLHTRHIIDGLIAQDDNRLPFTKLRDSGGQYCINDIDAFVVPLYEKMYLNAENVLKLYPYLMESPLLSIPEKNFVVRVYMTSSRFYKREIRKHHRMPREMRQAQLELPMPKFIWLVELAMSGQYDQGFTDYRFIIDSTANQFDPESFLFIHDREKMIINDQALTERIYDYKFDHALLPYELYTNNLQWRAP